MKIEPVSVTYARALIDLAAPKRLEPVMEDVRFLAKLIREDREFRAFIESPSIGAARKRVALDKVFRGKLDDLALDFVELVVLRRRQALLGEIFASCETLYDAAVGRIQAEATTAVPLSAERRDAIAADLGKKLGKNVVLHNSVRPEILGGLILRYGDLVADDSVKTSLTRIAGRLLARRPGSELVHEN